MNPYKCNGRQNQAALCCSAPPYEKESVIILAQQAVLGNLASIKKENEQYQRIGDPFLNWCGLPPPLAHPLWVSDWLFIGRKLIHLNLLAKLVCIKCKSIQTLFITSKFANCQLPFHPCALPREEQWTRTPDIIRNSTTLIYVHWSMPFMYNFIIKLFFFASSVLYVCVRECISLYWSMAAAHGSPSFISLYVQLFIQRLHFLM